MRCCKGGVVWVDERKEEVGRWVGGWVGGFTWGHSRTKTRTVPSMDSRRVDGSLPPPPPPVVKWVDA